MTYGSTEMEVNCMSEWPRELPPTDAPLEEQQYHIKGAFLAFLICAFLILGVPVIINLLFWPDIGVWSMIR